MKVTVEFIDGKVVRMRAMGLSQSEKMLTLTRKVGRKQYDDWSVNLKAVKRIEVIRGLRRPEVYYSV